MVVVYVKKQEREIPLGAGVLLGGGGTVESSGTEQREARCKIRPHVSAATAVGSLPWR